MRRLGIALAVMMAGAALGNLVVPARAGDVEAFAPNAHTMSGTLQGGEEHYVPLDLPAGALLSLQFRVNRKLSSSSQLLPEAELIASDGSSVAIPSALIKTAKGFDVKNLPIGVTGRHVLILRGATPAGGPYTLKVKAKYPKSFSGEFDGTGVDLAIPFPATAGAKVNASVKTVKGGAVPENPRVKQPGGNAFGPLKVAQKKTGFSFKNFEQRDQLGTHALTFALVPETAQNERLYKYKIVVKWPKVAKRTLTYSDLVIAPLLSSVSPDDLPISSDFVDLHVSGRFFQPGARLSLEKGGQPDWVLGNQVATDVGVTAPLQTSALVPGLWDVVVVNPSGGRAELSRSLLIRPPTPTIVSVGPSFTTDDKTSAAFIITGGQLTTATLVQLRRALPGGGEEVIDPISVTRPAGGELRVTINPFRRPLGTYDVAVSNPGPSPTIPGSETTVAADAFEIRNAAPRLTSTTPDRHLAGGAFSMAISGAELESGASAVLRREGEEDVDGSSEAVTPDGTSMTATFDMDGRTPGSWELHVVNPDDQSATLADAFAVSGVATASLTNSVIGEPAVDLAVEHDLGLVAWIESDEGGSGGSDWVVKARLFDTFINAWSGAAVTVSTPSQSSASKRFVSVAYNPDVDEWLVVWTEHTFQSTVAERVLAGLTPVSGTIYHVYGRRIDVDGALVGNEIDFIDNSLSATGSGQIYEQFEYLNPQVVHAPWDGNWYMTFTQQWDNLTVNTTPTTYTNDDFDVFVWRLDKDDPKLDTSFHLAIHTTQNHEGDCLSVVDTDRDKLFIVGSCDSRQLTAVNPREIEAKWVTSTGGIEPSSGGSNVGGVVQVTSRGSDSEDFTNPRPAYNGKAGEYLVVYERINEGSSGRKEIRAQRVSASSQAITGSEIVVAADASHDLILPRVVYNSDADEYLVTWTVDDATGSPRARGRRYAGSAASPDGDAFDLGVAGSGLPTVAVDTARGTYVRVYVTDFGAFADQRTGDGLVISLSD